MLNSYCETTIVASDPQVNDRNQTDEYAYMSLDRLGEEAYARVGKAIKYAGKTEEMQISAGILLREAKNRLKITRGRPPKDLPTEYLTWPAYLERHCNIGRARADELIQIADGRKSVEQLREEMRDRQRACRETRRDVTASSNPARKEQDAKSDTEKAFEKEVRALTRMARKLDYETLVDFVEEMRAKVEN